MDRIHVLRLRRFIERCVSDEPGRTNSPSWWRSPLLATAPVDERFEALPRIASPDHLSPSELLPDARSVIVFFLPFQKKLVKENRATDRPCRNWGLAYVQTNDLIERISRGLADLLAGQGFKTGLTPATHNFDEKKLMSRWSHKHLGHLVNLGRFGSHCMLITPSGCAGRLGSLVTDAELGDHPTIASNEACLLKAGHPCGKCMAACPVEALHENAFERDKCWNRLTENRDTLAYFADLPETTHVCGKCGAVMPCSFCDPVARVARPSAK